MTSALLRGRTALLRGLVIPLGRGSPAGATVARPAGTVAVLADHFWRQAAAQFGLSRQGLLKMMARLGVETT